MAMSLRHKKSHDLSNAPQQKPVFEQKQEKQKINFAQNSFFCLLFKHVKFFLHESDF